MHSSRTSKTLLILLCISFYFIARTHHAPPAPLPLDSPPSYYSAERAFTHVAQIASQPHPAGSNRAVHVQDYLVEQIKSMGIKPEIQEDIVYRKPCTYATVQNVIARIEGTSDKKNAIALMAHYDSVVFGPGAADDTSGVAALLESMRALKKEAPFQNDIIFVFTDGEEGRAFGGTGLRGAFAFVEKHPWAKDVRVAINFDARGTGGPAYMYQTSGKNAWLIKALAQSGCKAAATSLGYEVYSRMPVGSDLTAFINAGIPGYDCAFIRGLEKYHTMLDAPENLSLASLQHDGEYALKLTRYLANQPLEEAAAATENLVYFDLPGIGMFYYSKQTATIMMILVLILYLVTLFIGFRRGEVKIKQFLVATIGYLFWFTGCCIAGVIAVFLGYQARNVYILYSSHELTTGLLLIISGLSLLVFNHIVKKRGIGNAVCGLLLPWVVIAVVSPFLMPGASYVFTWPLLLIMPPILIRFLWQPKLERANLLFIALLAPAALTTILFTIGIFQGFYDALMFIFLPLHIAVILFGITMLIPHIRLLTVNTEKRITAVFVVFGVAFLLAGIFWQGFTAQQPKFNSITYGLNTNTGQAVYMSCDKDVDAWTTQFLGESPQRLPITDFIPIAQKDYLQAPAPSLNLSPPTLEILEDTTVEDKRTLRLRIDSPRKAEVMEVYALNETRILSAVVNDVPMTDPPLPWRLSYSIYRGKGINLQLEAPANQPVILRVSDHKYYLENILDYEPRPPEYIPKPNTVDFNKDPLKSEESIVTATFTLPKEQQT